MEKTLTVLFKVLFIAAISTFLFSSCSSDDDPEMEEEMMENPIVGEWTLANEVASLAVGSAVGEADWWFLPEEDLSARACLLDDVWSFSTDGTFSISQGSETWLETWQGVDQEGCGTPVAPHNGGSFSYTLAEGKLTLSGQGAFIGLAKAFNGGELSDGTSSEPSSRTYDILEMDDSRMKIGIPIAGEGNWTFIFTKQ